MANEGVAGELTLDKAAVQKREVQITLDFTPVRVRAVLRRDRKFLNLADLQSTINGTKVTVALKLGRPGDIICWQAFQS